MGAPAVFDTQRTTEEIQPTGAPRAEVCLGPVEGVPVGQGRAYQVGPDSVAVFRQRNGALYALQNECPHRGGPLSEGLLGNGTVICPFHAWKVDVATGECLTDPCHIRRFPVREESGRILLGIE